MKLFFVFLMTYSITTFAQGRGPAIEDFVGVETQNDQPTSKANSVSFNYEVSLNQDRADFSSSAFSSVFLLIFIFLPIGIWAMMSKRPTTKPLPDNIVEFKTKYNPKHVDRPSDEETKKAS